MQDRERPRPSELRALAFWLWLGCIGFGGPAGQIAVMHRELVDRKRWLSETRFLRALSFCMVLPGPEAQQLASYSGYTLYGIRGALTAGGLFILPGFLVMTTLSYVYVNHGDTRVVSGIVRGLAIAVVAVVLGAVLRIAGRVLRGPAGWAIAVTAFVASIAGAPFPLIIAAAAVAGMLAGRRPGLLEPAAHGDPAAGSPAAAGERHDWRKLRRRIAVGLVVWLTPLAALLAVGGVLGDLAWFFTAAALVTFGGAYAVLPFVADAAVHHFGWLTSDQMIAGLALGETTPGPLILVNTFVGYMAGSGDGTAMAIAGAAVATYFTFTPSFLFIVIGAPLIDRIPDRGRVASALTGVTVAVVGVVAGLAVFVGRNVLVDDGRLDVFACLLAAAAFMALRLERVGIVPVIAACALAGLIEQLV
jgi:chromate transporter